ncbi:hypothetical protein CR51_07400 [Caballeronia megalochromosomata]|nr:hypothetical protein CR51_07400 [Caballeronia megalochromosomata]
MSPIASPLHGEAFCPSSRNIGQNEAVHEVVVDLGATPMLDEINLKITRQRIIPVRERPDWHRTANRIADPTSASALTGKSLFPHIT